MTAPAATVSAWIEPCNEVGPGHDGRWVLRVNGWDRLTAREWCGEGYSHHPTRTAAQLARADLLLANPAAPAPPSP